MELDEEDEAIRATLDAFVRLITSRDLAGWRTVECMSDDELRIVLMFLEVMGTNVQRIHVGRLPQCEIGQGSQFPIIVLQQSGESPEVTTWLQTVVDDILTVYAGQPVLALRRMLSTMLPMRPIQLTLDGDMLVQRFVSSRKRPVRATDTLLQPVGLHDCCFGKIERMRSSKEKDALLCHQCGLRVTFQNCIDAYDGQEVATYGQLRDRLRDEMNLARQLRRTIRDGRY